MSKLDEILAKIRDPIGTIAAAFADDAAAIVDGIATEAVQRAAHRAELRKPSEAPSRASGIGSDCMALSRSPAILDALCVDDMTWKADPYCRQWIAELRCKLCRVRYRVPINEMAIEMAIENPMKAIAMALVSGAAKHVCKLALDNSVK